jgi:hypothetical protein
MFELKEDIMDNQTNHPFGVTTQQPEIKCSNCGVPLIHGQAFCALCGTPAPTHIAMPTAKVCINCGNELPMDAEFCSNCGHKIVASAPQMNPTTAPEINPAIAQYNSTVKEPKKESKKSGALIAAGIVLVLAIITGVILNNSTQEQKRQDAIAAARAMYIENAEEFCSLSLTAGSNLEDIADTVQQYWYDAIWKDYYSGDINIAIARALSAKSSAISTASTYDSQMKSLYNQLRHIPEGLEDDYTIKELNKAIKDLYNIYTDYYDFATDPSGSYNSFSASNGDKTDDYIAAYKALSNLVN